MGERSVRIRKAVSSNLIISMNSLPYGGLFYSRVCSSVDRALDSGSRCAGSTPVRRIKKTVATLRQSFSFCMVPISGFVPADIRVSSDMCSLSRKRIMTQNAGNPIRTVSVHLSSCHKNIHGSKALHNPERIHC